MTRASEALYIRVLTAIVTYFVVGYQAQSGKSTLKRKLFSLLVKLGIAKDPLKSWVLIKCSGAVLVGHCTCMAGLAERLVPMLMQSFTGLKPLKEYIRMWHAHQKRINGSCRLQRRTFRT